jgi:hypothetical protein
MYVSKATRDTPFVGPVSERRQAVRSHEQNLWNARRFDSESLSVPGLLSIWRLPDAWICIILGH